MRPEGNLQFFPSPPNRIFFRGTVRVRYPTDTGSRQTRYVHIVQKRGQQGDPFVQITLPPQATRPVQVELLYPPDATPPQVLTIQTLGSP